jgi:adenine-specific DNA-methyltransferase
MATGVPKTNWRGFSAANPPSKNTGADTGVTLAYEGKRSAAAILETAPAKLVRLWPKRAAGQSKNRLLFGDNLPLLSTLAQDPDVRGQVRLVYIDPPYATRSVFQSRKLADAYADLLEGAKYLEFLRERLVFLREILAADGSIYLHLDENMAFQAKVLMDEIFGRANFRNWITRKKCNPKNYTRKTYGNVADYILFYSKSEDFVWHRPVDFWTADRAQKEYQYSEPETGRRYKKVPVHAPGVRNGETGKPWRGKLPPTGKHWQYPPKTLDEMDARGEIYWSPTGNPRRKIYLDQSAGVPVQDIWLEFRDAHNQNIQITGYPTEKNPKLLERIIAASSNPGDLILDCFAGSGTTLDVAHRLGRQWIGMDNSAEAIRATLTRFSHGLSPMGDFVDRPETAEHEEPLLPMLDLPETTIERGKPPHEAVTDYILSAAEPYDGTLAECLTTLQSSLATV